MFSTDSLAYKIRNNKLKKHSEQFNKWLAGFKVKRETPICIYKTCQPLIKLFRMFL